MSAGEMEILIFDEGKSFVEIVEFINSGNTIS